MNNAPSDELCVTQNSVGASTYSARLDDVFAELELLGEVTTWNFKGLGWCCKVVVRNDTGGLEGEVSSGYHESLVRAAAICLYGAKHPAELVENVDGSKPVAWIVECLIDGVWCPQFPAHSTYEDAAFAFSSFRETVDKRMVPLFGPRTPLTDEQCDRLISGLGMGAVAQVESNRRMLHDLCRRAHDGGWV